MDKHFPSCVCCCALAVALACLLLAPSSVRAQTGGGRGLTFNGAGGPGAVTLSSSMGQFNSPFSMMGGMGMMGMGGMGMGGMGGFGMGGKAFGFNGGYGQ